MIRAFVILLSVLAPFLPAALLVATAAPARAAETFVVTAETASLGRQPSSAAERLGWLPLGERVEVVNRDVPGEWLQVSARGGQLTGYLHATMAVPEAEAIKQGEEMFRLAYAAMRAGHYPEAAGHFAVGLALHPGDGIASFYAGETALVLGRKDRAAELFRAALRLAPRAEEAVHAKSRLAQIGSPAAGPAAGAPAADAAGIYVVTAKVANVRAGPSTATEQREWIRRGERITASVAAEDADWLRIERDGRPAGYLHRSLAMPEAQAGAESRALFAKAFEVIKAKRYEEAAALLEDGLALDPTDGRASFYAGEAYLALGDRPRATAFYEAARRLAPGTEQDMRAAARLAEMQGARPAVGTDDRPPAAPSSGDVQRDLRAGADLFDRALRTTQEIPGLADRYFAALTVARLQAKAGWHAAAQDTFGQIIAAAPAFEDVDPAETLRRRVWAVAGAADIQCLAGYPTEARTTHAKATELAGSDAELLTLVIGTQQRCGLTDDARKNLAAIEKLVPNAKAAAAARDEFRYNLAAVLSDEGIFDAALAHARAVSNRPWKAFALAGIALELRRYGRFDEARRVFDEAAKVLPAGAPQSGPLKERIDAARDDPSLLPEAIGSLLRDANFALARNDLRLSNASTTRAMAVLDQAKRAGTIAPERQGLAAADLVQQLVDLGRMDDARKVAAGITDPVFTNLAQARITAAVAMAGDPKGAEKALAKLEGDARITALVGIAIGHGRAGDAAAGRAAAEKAVALIEEIESREARAGLFAETAVAYFALAP